MLRGPFGVAFFVLAMLGTPAAGDIVLDADGRAATIRDGGRALALRLRLDGRCMIDDLAVLGRQVIAPKTGVCTAVKVGGAWHTTRDHVTPSARLDGGELIVSGIRYGPESFPVSEQWRFNAAGDRVEWTIARTYHAPGRLEDTYFPGMDFAGIDAWTGGLLDSGGVVWTKYLDTPTATFGNHTGAVTFWNRSSGDCLEVTTSCNDAVKDTTARFSRHPSGVFSASFWPSVTPPTPAHGLARFLPDRQDVWRPAEVAVDAARPLTVTNTVTLRALPCDRVMPADDLKGVDGPTVREMLNTIARYGVIDRGIAGGNGWRSSFVCTHEPWTAEYGLAVADPRMIGNFSRTLDEWRRWAVRPDGRVLARWHNDEGDAMPGTFDAASGYYEAQWGYMLDSQPSYVVCVAEQFDLTGDLPWLRSHADACRAALEYMLSRDADHDGLMEVIPQSFKEERGSDWIDIVWASHENALVNAEMYEALNLWAACEALMGEQTRADRCRGAAAKLKEAFNRPTGDGGFWSSEHGWYVYWREADGSIHGDNLVTPVNFAAIAYGLCDEPSRRTAILGRIETLMQKEGLFHWPLCFFPFKPEEVHARQKVFPEYENGDLFLSWAEAATRAYVKTDPAIAMKYIRGVIDRYAVDGLFFQRCLRRGGAGAGDDILAGNAMAIVGLYRDIYGVRPRYDRLFLDPHLTPELRGTKLSYPLRGTRYVVELGAERTVVSAGGASVSCSGPFGVDIGATGLKFFPTIDRPAELSLSWTDGGGVLVEVKSWPAETSTGMRAWTLRPVAAGAGVSQTIAGLPPNAWFTLRREGEASSRVRSSEDGELALTATRVGGPTRFSLEPAGRE